MPDPTSDRWTDVPTRASVIVIGAGIAGLATAYHLVRSGVTDVLVVERESLPASHASGRNAAIFRQIAADPINCRMAVATVQALQSLPWARDLVRRSGSLTLAEESEAETLRAEQRTAESVGVETTSMDAREVCERVPILARERVSAAVWTPGDGVIDIHGLTSGLLERAREGGARILLGCDVNRLLTRAGRAAGIVTEHAEIHAEAVVNAAGPWASELGRDAGAPPLPLRPVRRHLSLLEPEPRAFDAAWPVVWDISAPFYFRPESGALLVSACDEDDAPPIVDPMVHDRIWSAARRVAPELAAARVRRTWACQRVLTPDSRFIVGEDPVLRGLFWVTGFGGHGMSAGYEAGRIAAAAVQGRSSDYGVMLAPDRFTRA